jgi:hypothetical protein
VHDALKAGADEVITDRMDATEQSLRLQVTLQRADNAKLEDDHTQDGE